MNKEMSCALKALTNSGAIKQSKVGRIRELMPELLHAQQAGLRLADIAKALNESGFEGMNLKCLQNLMYQARAVKKRLTTSTQNVLFTPATTDYHNITKTVNGIHAESILEAARKAMLSKPPASSLTLDLLRAPPAHSNTIERK